MAFSVTFWGVRGSIPAPGTGTVRYGGNTPCISVELEESNGIHVVVLDAGTGIRVLGISGISNVALTEPVEGQETSHEEVLAAGQQIVPRLTALIHGVLAHLKDG